MLAGFRYADGETMTRLSRRTLYSLLAAGALLVALAVLVALRFHAPPEVARLLPESDAIVYANLKPVRAATTPLRRS